MPKSLTPLPTIAGNEFGFFNQLAAALKDNPVRPQDKALLNRTTLSSYDLDKMKKNGGGVTIYLGPKTPAGLEANWMPIAGMRPLPAMRFGPTAAFLDKAFKRPDFEVID
jgi:hypothetical protein